MLAGTDGIRPELIKHRGIKLLSRMYELVRQIWEPEGVPEDWKETIIVPINKKKEIGIGVKITGDNIRKCSLQNFDVYNSGKN